ncbi:transposase family protein [Streptomyces syringium]|uniref:transposase family protein n=1 Tax=Streptomyces syringium TaxID=76729 RepID=UPI0033F8DC5C
MHERQPESEARAWRYVEETPEIRSSWAPGLHEALVGLGEGDFVVVDGTLVPTDRIKADQPYYSRKHRGHGMNVQVIARPDGTPLWFSRAQPGQTHDLTTARAHGIVQACLPRQILVWPTAPAKAPAPPSAPPYKNHRELPDHYKRFDHVHTSLRAPGGERAFARLKSWRILRRAT